MGEPGPQEFEGCFGGLNSYEITHMPSQLVIPASSAPRAPLTQKDSGQAGMTGQGQAWHHTYELITTYIMEKRIFVI